jgi:hypothetical protein
VIAHVGGVMRRMTIAIAIVATAATLALAACTTDVIPTGRDRPSADATGFNAPGPVTLCGVDGSTRAGVFMLTQRDVWPDSSTTRQGYTNYTLDPTACAGILAATPKAQPVDCGVGFPYYPQNQQVSELARINIVAFHVAQLLNVASDGTVASTVSEVVLNLGPGSGPEVEALARRCGAQTTAGVLQTSVRGSIDMILQVDASRAVALTFDLHTGFTNAQKVALLNKAEALASY